MQGMLLHQQQQLQLLLCTDLKLQLGSTWNVAAIGQTCKEGWLLQ